MYWRLEYAGCFSAEPSGRCRVRVLPSAVEPRTSKYASESLTKNVVNEGLSMSVILLTPNDVVDLPSLETAIRSETALAVAVRTKMAPSAPHTTGAVMNGSDTPGTSTLDSTCSVTYTTRERASDDCGPWPAP